MKKRLLILMVTLTAVLQTAWAYDFSATSPSGHTLYYEIISGTTNVGVVRPGTGSAYNTYNNYVTGNVVIPATVVYNNTTYNVTELRSIYVVSSGYDYGSFDGCSGLTSITIPNSVTTIGGYAFYGCTGLTSVIIPNSVTTIEHYAFSGCSGLPSITIPNSVTTIGDNAFNGVINIVYYGTATDYYNWGAMYRNKYYESGFVYEDSTKTILLKYVGTDTNVTIPNSVDTIGAYAFQNSGLTSITIPENVRYVGYKAFGVDYDHSSSLTTVVWNAKNAFIDTDGMNSDIDSPFYGCSNISTVTFGDSVRVIPDYLFTNRTGLTSVTIGNSVTTIGGSAFAGCSGLTSVTIPNSVTTIGGSAFAGCTGLTSVTIGNSVTTIRGSAFRNCTGLTSVTLPNSVDTIGAFAFYNTGLTSITIPENVRHVGNKAFGADQYDESGNIIQSSSSLTTVVWNAKNASIASDGWNYDSPFSGCSNISTVTFGDSVRVIPHYLFTNCTGLTSVTLPNSVDTIGAQAFYNTGLTSITIPENVRYIGSNAFGIDVYGNQSSSLTTVVWNAKNASIASDGWNYDSPFFGCSNISTVTFGDSVRVIPDYLFPSVAETPNVYYGRDIESWINIKRINSENYEYGMFGYGNYNLYINNQLVTNLVVPGAVDTIQAGTFHLCSSIQSVTIPTQIEFIGRYAFLGCNNLSSVTWNAINCDLEGGLVFGDQYGDQSITNLVLGDSVQVIPDNVFSSFAITNVNLPNSLTSIGEQAFEECINLASITIPSQVTTIGDEAFKYCTNLRSITMEPTVPPTIYTGTFYGVGTGVMVNVPCGTVEDYSSAAFWFNFSNIRQSSECVRTITAMSLNASQGTVLGGGTYEYGSTATIAAIPQTGYQFYQWNDGNTSNPRSLVVSTDSSFIATFSSITTGGGVTHDTLYVDRYIYDTIYTTIHDTVSNTVHDTITTTVHDTITNTVYDTIDNFVYDTVYITETDTLWLFDTIYMHDTIYIYDTIYIRDSTTDIEDVSVINAKIYSSRSRIVVEGADGNSVMLFDMQGRLLSTKRDEYSVLEFEVPISGAYFVKIGNYKAKKVVVIK